MTPMILFEYIVAVVSGIGLGALLVVYAWSVFTE